MENLFSRPVLDLSWSSSGLQLMACSLDGTVAYFEFTESELGRPLSVEEKNALYEKTYGKSFGSSHPGTAMVLENPSLVSVTKKPAVAEPEVTKISPAKVLPVKPLSNKQIETRTSDGRRRITPVFIPPEVDSGEGPAPFSSEPIKFSSSNESKSRIVIERREEVVAPNVSTPVKVEIKEQHGRQRMMEEAPPAGTVDKPMAPFRRNLDKTLSVITRKPARFPENKMVTAGAGAVAVQREGERSRGGEGVSLPCPQLPPTTRHVISGSSKCLVIENESCLSPFGRLTQVKLMMAGKLLWETVLGCAACKFAANTSLLALACVDGTLHLLDTTSGARVLPALVLGAPAAHLALAATKLLCVTTSGRLSVWCLERRTSLVTNQTVQPLLTGIGQISQCSVTLAGVPTVVLDSGRAFMYSLELNTWMRLADNTDPAVRNTQRSFQSAWQSLPDNGAVPLRTVQSHCHNSMERGLIHRMDNTSLCTQSYLEDQLVICKTLKSAAEFRFWFIANIRFLLQEGMEARLRTVCETLMREAGEADQNCLWNPSVLGIDRVGLLREVLSELASSPHSQRLYTEFSEQLKSSTT